MIHDKDDMESRVYAGINRKIDTAKSFAFMSEHSIFLYLKTEQMNAQQFKKQSGYELWHRGMAQSTNQNIRESISCTRGMEIMESLIGQRYELHVKCPSCMIGKATIEDFLSLKGKVALPLYQMNIDSFSPSVKSVERYCMLLYW